MSRYYTARKCELTVQYNTISDLYIAPLYKLSRSANRNYENDSVNKNAFYVSLYSYILILRVNRHRLLLINLSICVVNATRWYVISITSGIRVFDEQTKVAIYSAIKPVVNMWTTGRFSDL